MKVRLTAKDHHCSVDGIAFAASLPRGAQRRLEAMTQSLEVRRGGVLVREGEVGRRFLVMAEGCIKLSKAMPDGRCQIVAFRRHGDVLSLHRCHTPWPVTAQAITASTVYSIDWDDLQQFAARHPTVDRALVDITADELTGLQNHLLTLGRKTIEEKVASFILELCQSHGLQAGMTREFRLPMRRPDIADYLGVTTESICREFSRFKREKLISLPRPSHVVLLNRPVLEAMASGASRRNGSSPWPLHQAIERHSIDEPESLFAASGA